MKNIILLAVAGVLSSGAAYADGKLNIYNWSDYIAEDTIANFKAETGIDVTYDVYDSNEILEAKMSAGSSGYDLVVPTADFLARGRQAGVYAEMDFSRIPNAKNQSAQVQALANKQMQDDKSGLVYMWGTTGIAYNEKKIAERLGDNAPTDSWSLILDPANAAKLADCGIAILDAPTDILPNVISYLGKTPTIPDTGCKVPMERGPVAGPGPKPTVGIGSKKSLRSLPTGQICLEIHEFWRSASRGRALQKRCRCAPLWGHRFLAVRPDSRPSHSNNDSISPAAVAIRPSGTGPQLSR